MVTSQDPPQQALSAPKRKRDDNIRSRDAEVTGRADAAIMLATQAKLHRQLAATMAALVLRAQWYARHTSSRTAAIKFGSSYKWDQKVVN